MSTDGRQPQLRGKKLLARLEQLIREEAADAASCGLPYRFIAARLADRAGCSRTTLLKYQEFLLDVARKVGADERRPNGTKSNAALLQKVKRLELRLAESERTIAALYGERLAFYDGILRNPGDIAGLLRRVHIEVSGNTSACTLCGRSRGPGNSPKECEAERQSEEEPHALGGSP